MIQTIIIADDSSAARMVTRRCLEIAGYGEARLLDARDGCEALQLLHEHQPDLLITDLNMPQMDGAALLKKVKASPRFHELPVLVISSMSNPVREEELCSLGAFAVLCKPVSPASLSKVLQSLEARSN